MLSPQVRLRTGILAKRQALPPHFHHSAVTPSHSLSLIFTLLVHVCRTMPPHVVTDCSNVTPMHAMVGQTLRGSDACDW